jgi:uncharacterized membrane-anchored protein
MRTLRLFRSAFATAAALVVGLALHPAFADVAPQAGTAPAAGYTQYQLFLKKTATVGPATIRLRDQAALALPADAAFLPLGPAKALMQKLGNATDDNFIGIIMPWQESDWFITLDYIPAGYVADDDAKNWKADDLLTNIRENTDKENEERKKQGVPGLQILGWVEKPHYDQPHHRVIWSILARDEGAREGAPNIINYRMLALGRQGYLAMIMVTDATVIEARKPIANTMLSQVTFDPGKRYSDFNSSTDDVAEYGLAALIGGVVAHKLGFFALIAAFFVKGAKFIAVAVIGALAAVRRFFRRGKPEPVVASAAPLAPPAAPVAPTTPPPANPPA